MELLIGIGIGYLAGALITALLIGCADAAKPFDFEDKK